MCLVKKTARITKYNLAMMRTNAITFLSRSVASALKPGAIAQIVLVIEGIVSILKQP